MRRRRRRRDGDPARRRPDEAPRRIDGFEPDMEWLMAVMQPYSVPLDSSAPARLCVFARELISWNDRLNLLSRADAPQVIRKHVAASLGVFLVAHPTPGEQWIDVGTGAGFPGMVLKIAQPDLHITLLDSARKRCLFLENVIRGLQLDRVPVLPLRVETLVARHEGLGQYQVLTARAVTSLIDTVRGFGPLVAPGGRIVTFKGPMWHEEVASLSGAGVMKTSGFELESVTRIPWIAGHLVTLRKNSPSMASSEPTPPPPPPPPPAA